jgi:tetratricopeptide (TPR) repeat protein
VSLEDYPVSYFLREGATRIDWDNENVCWRRQKQRFNVACLRGDLAEAERQVGKLERRSPNNYSAYSMRGAIGMAHGRTAEARTSYDRALEILQSGADLEFRKWTHDARYRRALEGIAELRERAAR